MEKVFSKMAWRSEWIRVSMILMLLTISYQVRAHVFDAVVAKDGTGNFSSVQDAIDAAPEHNAKPYLIFVKNGEYDELVEIPESKPFIHLIGQDPEKTIIKRMIHCGGVDDVFFRYSVNNHFSESYKKHSVFDAMATDFYTENITYQNTYGVERQSGPQALAMRSYNDRQSFYNCRFRSFQDTWLTSSDDHVRQYINNCWIEGAVDYLFGGGNILAEECTFYNVRSGSVITAPCHVDAEYGYVFRNCIVDGNQQAADGNQKLGRPWHNNAMTVFINTTMKIPIAPEGWTDMGTVPRLFAEYGSKDIHGNLLDLSRRKTEYKYTKKSQTETGGVKEEQITGSCRAVISSDEASRYTYENMILGSDGWNPRQYMEELSATKKIKLSKFGTLRWTPVAGAIGYLVIDSHEKVVDICSNCTTNIQFPDKSYTIRAVSRYGHIGLPASIPIE